MGRWRQANYDWRPVDPLRKIDSAPSRAGLGARLEYRPRRRSGARTRQRTTSSRLGLNEQGAPENFSPEVPKSGMYALSSGQQPQGSLNPGQPTRPEIALGRRCARSRLAASAHLRNVRTPAADRCHRSGPRPTTTSSTLTPRRPTTSSSTTAVRATSTSPTWGRAAADVGSQPRHPMYRTDREPRGAALALSVSDADLLRRR